jgi:ubiquinol-cytochrome c reductase cytochrome b subunit
MNFGQMLMWHIVLLPIGIVLLTGLHVMMVRRRGIVPPFELDADGKVVRELTAEEA